MRVFCKEKQYYIDIAPNISIIKQWPCKICGRQNSPEERVDTENIWRQEESYCIACWVDKLFRRP